MPGQAQSNSFLLSSATVCIGPTASLYDLNPTAHSIGLVKNFQAVSEPTYVEMTQGIRNSVAMSVRNNDGLRCSMEVYEYSLRNLAYAAGLDASGASFNANTTSPWLSTASITAAATAIIVPGDVTATVAVGDWIYIQNGLDDYVHIAKVSARVFSTNTTITFAGYAIPAGLTFPIGSRVGEVQRINLGAAVVQPDLCAKVIGVMPKDQRPVVIMYPKIKITKGFGLSFQVDNFQNMPFEFTPYALVSGDSYYSDFGDNMMALYPGV